MVTLRNEIDLGNAYTEWLKSKSLGGGNEYIWFGQYVYNKYNLEYENSYNERCANVAYKMLLEGINSKGECYES